MKEQLDRIEAKLDRVIKAMQEYDGLDEDFKDPYDEYGQYKKSPCVNHDEASWEEEMNERMDIIGQNGNEGLHYEVEAKPKPKKKYYHNKNKKDGNNKKSS
jgi:hypothetical protein